jgi:hypothetical protein
VAGDFTNATTEIMGTLEEVLTDMSDNYELNELGLAEKIVDAQKDVSHKQIEAVGLVVEKKQSGESSISDEETQDLVFKTIVKMTKDVEISGTSTNKIMNDVSTVTLTASGTVKVTSSTESVADVKIQVEKANETIQGEMENAIQLAGDGQLLEALEKVKQVNDINSEIRQVVAKVNQDIKIGVNEANLNTATNDKPENSGVDVVGTSATVNPVQVDLSGFEGSSNTVTSVIK